MNNLLFTAIVIALLYYFFYYLPNQKKNIGPANTKPITQDQETQTDELVPENTINCPGPQHVQFPSKQVIPDPEAIKKLQTDINQKEQTIIGLNNSYSKLEQKKAQEIDNLKKQLQAKDNKIKELSEVEKSLDDMIKGMQDLNKNL